MATYLQGVQDTMEGVAPPQANLQFEAQLLSTRQGKYDAAHKQLSQMYGTILNSSLTREDNMQARDEFFKLVDGDLRKIAGMDLSLESNVSKAQNVFKQVYDNDYLVKDMVWTKNYQNQMQRAESFKTCIDPDKCGGEYWDDGVKYMQYKKEEYANTDRDDALGFQDVEYVPYHNIMDKAMKAAKDSGLNITRDDVIGDYMVRTKNGDLLVSPLTDLFNKLYGENPGYQKQFEVESYNERKDWAANQVAQGKYKNINEAEVGYITSKSKEMNDAVERIQNEVGADNEVIDKRLVALTEKIQNGEVTQGSAEEQEYIQLKTLKGMSDQAKSFAEVSNYALKKANNHRAIRDIGAQLDQSTAVVKLDNHLKEMAITLSNRDSEVTKELDEKAKMRIDHGYKVALENLQQQNKIDLESWKLEHGHSSYKKEDGGLMSVGRNIEKEFGTVFGSQSSQKLKNIKAEADAKYPIISADELAKLATKPGDPNWAKRQELEKQNERNTKYRANRILRKQAEALDKINKDAGNTTSYATDLKNLGADAPVGSVSVTPTGGEAPTGPGTGGTPTPTGGETAGVPSFGTKGTWFNDAMQGIEKDIAKKTTNAQAKGEPEKKKEGAKPKTGSKDVTVTDLTIQKFSDAKFDATNTTDQHLAIIAQTHPDVEKRKLYNSILEKGGSAYLATLPKEKADYFYSKIGKRIDEAGKQYDGFKSTYSTMLSYSELQLSMGGSAGKFIAESEKEAQDLKYTAGQRIGVEYFKTRIKDSKELYQSKKWVNDYLLMNGRISQEGELTYGGKSYGFIYKKLDYDIPKVDKNGKTYYEKDVNRARGGFTGNQTISQIVAENKKKLGKKFNDKEHGYAYYREKYFIPKENYISSNAIVNLLEKDKFIGSAYYRNNAKGKIVPEKDGNFFKSKAYTDLTTQYDIYDHVTTLQKEGRKDASAKMINALQAKLSLDASFIGGSIDAEDFLENGVFQPSKYIKDNPALVRRAKQYFLEAADEVYTQKNLNPYMPGIGALFSRTLEAWDVNVLSDDQYNSTVKDVRNFLNHAVTGSISNNTMGYTLNGKVIADEDAAKNAINKFQKGKVGIRSFQFNPIGGTDPRGVIGSERQDIGDWTVVQIIDDNGNKHKITLDNAKHPTTLYAKAVNTPLTNILNLYGQYDVVNEDKAKNDPIVNKKPIQIFRKSDSELGVTGKIWDYDETAQVGMYRNINDIFNDNNISLSGAAPEEIEPVITEMLRVSKMNYDKYNPKAKL